MCTVKSADVMVEAFTYIRYMRRTAGSCVTLRPGSSRRSLGATCQQRLRQTFKWYMWARQGLRRHADRYDEVHLIKTLDCSELMNFQTN